MASFKKVKDIVTAGNNKELNWGYSKNDERHPAIWYSTDGYVIRYTEDPEIISMCRLYANPMINVRKINVTINLKADMELTREEIRKYKRGHLYVLDRDPNHWLAFASVHIGEFLALKQDLIFRAYLIEGRPVLVVFKRYKDMFITDLQTISLIMGVRRC